MSIRSTSKNKDFIENTLSKFNDFELEILTLWSCFVPTVTRTGLLDMTKKLASNCPKSYTVKEQKLIIEKFLVLKVASNGKKGLILSEPFYFYLLHKGIVEGHMQNHIDIIEKSLTVFPEEGYYNYRRSVQADALFLYLVNASLKSDKKEIKALCETAYKIDSEIFFNVSEGLLRFFKTYFGLDKLPIESICYSIENAIYEAMKDFKKGYKVKEFLTALSMQPSAFSKLSEEACCDIIFFHILQGNMKEAEIVATHCSQNIQSFYVNTISFVTNNSPIDEVVTEYEKIFKNWFGSISKYKFISYLLFFYPLAALIQKSSSVETLKVVKKFMVKNQNMDSITCDLKEFFKRFWGYKIDGSKEAYELDSSFMPRGTRNLSSFFYILCGALLKRHSSDNAPEFVNTDNITQMVKYLRNNSYNFIESEFTHICDFYNVSHTVANLFDHEKIHSFTEKGLIHLVERSQPWETMLHFLELEFSEKVNKKSNNCTQKSKRLVWVIHYVGSNYYTFTPKEQTISKSGKWTKGRKVATKRFREHDIESAEECDYQAANKALCEESGGWYGSTNYYFDEGKLALALIGADNIYVEEHGNLIHTELVQSEVELKMEESDNGIKLSVSPCFEHKGIFLLRETITRHRVYNVKKTTANLVKNITAAGITIPKREKTRLDNLIPKLSQTVAVTTNSLGNEDNSCPHIKLKPELKVRLFPFSNGIRIETIVGPYSDKERTFHPGQGTQNFFADLDGVHSQFIRNTKSEQKLFGDLLKSCPTLEQFDDGSFSWFIEELEPALETVSELNEVKDNYTIEWPEGEKLPFAATVSFEQLNLRVKSDNDWFELEGEVKVNNENLLTARELIEPTEQHGRFIKMSDGRFVALSKKLQKELERARALVQTDQKRMRLHPTSPLGLDDFLEATNADVDDQWKKRVESIKKVKNKNYKLPAGLNAELRDYQHSGYKWLSRLSDLGFGACLADDMGLGKTVQALSVLVKRKTKGPALVVAPASVCENWQREIIKFTPSLNPSIFSEIENREKAVKKAKNGDVLIVTYGLLHSSDELFQSKKWGTLILDEAQMIKNHQAKRTKAAHALDAGFKIITTGTPVENNLLELWSLFEFINPGLLGNKRKFFNKFSKSIEVDHNRSSMRELKNLVKPFILRRKKMDVLEDLPPKTEIPLHIEMTQTELGIYEALRDKAINEMTGDGVDNAQFLILAHLTKLRRACCHTALATKKKTGESSKLNQLIELMTELKSGGHRVLIFSQFVDFLKLAAKELDKNKFTYQYLDGSTPVKKRLNLVDKFQNGNGDAFLISLKAGGTGLNLTAADYVIHLDPWWNPASEDQASDRAHRIGQQRPVTVYRFITKGTVEEKISRMHHEKRELSESLLSGAEVASKMSVDEIIDLLK